MLFHKSHDGDAEHRTGQTINNAEQISEKKADHDDADNGDKEGLFPGVALENEEDRQIGQSQLDSRDAYEEREETLDVAENNGEGGKNTDICDFAIHDNVARHVH